MQPQGKSGVSYCCGTRQTLFGATRAMDTPDSDSMSMDSSSQSASESTDWWSFSLLYETSSKRLRPCFSTGVFTKVLPGEKSTNWPKSKESLPGALRIRNPSGGDSRRPSSVTANRRTPT